MTKINDMNALLKITPSNPNGSPRTPKIKDAMYVADYTIKEGGTLSGVSNKFQIDKSEIIKNNPELKNKDLVNVGAGTTLKVPGHTAVKGDTASGIARKYGMTLDEFLELNGMKNKTTMVRAGQTYYIYGKPSKTFKRLYMPDTIPETVPKPEPKKEEKVKLPLPKFPAAEHKIPYKADNTETKAQNLAKEMFGFANDEVKPPFAIEKPEAKVPAAPKITLDKVATIEDVAAITQTSTEFIEKLIKHEGKRDRIYVDPTGHEAVGIGHDLTHRDANERAYFHRRKNNKQKLSDKEIYQILAKDLLDAKRSLKRTFGDDYSLLTSKQKEALTDLTFNIGAGSLNKSTELINKTKKACDYLKKGDEANAKKWFDSAATEFTHCRGQKGILPGLCLRRIENIINFCEAEPKDLPDNVKFKINEIYNNGLLAMGNKEYYKDAMQEIVKMDISDFSSNMA